MPRPPPAAAALSRCFAMKVGILPESILPKMLVDRLVLKGAVLQARLGGREGGAHPVAQACHVVQLSSTRKT